MLRKHFRGGQCNLKRDLTGQVIVITGANAGIGKETTRSLAYTGATIIMACRSRERAQPVLDEIVRESGNRKISLMILDLAELASVRAFAQEFNSKYERLDILINNAGIGYSK